MYCTYYEERENTTSHTLLVQSTLWPMAFNIQTVCTEHIRYCDKLYHNISETFTNTNDYLLSLLIPTLSPTKASRNARNNSYSVLKNVTMSDWISTIPKLNQILVYIFI